MHGGKTARLSRAELFMRTIIGDTFNSTSPVPVDIAGDEFLTAAAIGCILLLGRNTPLKYCGSNRPFEEFSKTALSFLKAGLDNLDNQDTAKGFPWMKLFATEPEGSFFARQALLDKMERDLLPLIGDQWPLENLGGRQMRVSTSPLYDDFKREWEGFTQKRRLFRTDQGFLGVGLDDLDVGDELWVLAGARTPSVLRKTESGNRKFMGEAYVHGMMRGEVLGWGLEIQSITLE